MSRWRRAYIGIGANLGDRQAQVDAAVAFLAAGPQTRLVRLSRVRETAPVGPPQPAYLNAVAEIETPLAPRALLDLLLDYEAQAGRVRRERWGPRLIDLDILLVGDEVVDTPGLTVPHPELARRRFVLEPLVELAPELTPPGQGETVAALLSRLPPE